jgi:hypothetical protein
MAFYDQLGSFFTDETEEERLRREEEEAAKNAVPFKQTIVTDPVTGKQTMKMEGALEDFTEANPNTPTIAGPVSPDVMPKREMMPEQYVGTPGFNPAAAPVMPEAPVTFSDIRGQEVDMQPQVDGQPTMPASAPAAPVAPATTAPTMEGVMAGPPREAMSMAERAVLERQQQQQPPQATTAPQPTIQTDDEGNQLITTADGRTMAVGPDGRPLPFGGVAVEQIPQARNFLAAQNNPQKLLEIADDKSGTYNDFEKRLASRQLMDTLTYQRVSKEGETMAREALQTGDPKKINKIYQDRSEGITAAGVAKAFLYSLIGFESGAKDVVNRMGLGATWQQYRDANGNPVLVRVAADGLPLEAVDQNGQALSREQLVQFGGVGAGSKFKPDVSTQDVEKGDIKGRVVTETRNGRTNTFVESGGKRYAYDSSWKPVSIGVAGAKAEATKAVEMRYAGPIAYTKAGADFAGRFNAENGTNIGYQTQTPGAPLVDLNTGQRIVPNANGTITATRTGGTTVSGGTTGTGGMTPAQIKTQTAVSEASQRVFAEKRIPEIIEEGSQGGEVARIRREQLDTIRDNPSILGIYQGRGDNYDRARNVITNVISGAYGEENTGKLRDDLKAISISPAEKAALENFANLNMQINTKTLKANTGGGQISGAEQKINRDTNLTDIASQTPLASMQGLHRSMFVGDLNNARSSFLTANPNFNTDAAFASAWSKKKSEATRGYEGIMRERAEFLRPYAPPRNASPAQIAAFNERVFKAFEMYPAPRWDSENNRWNYQTKNAELAAAKALEKR